MHCRLRSCFHVLVSAVILSFPLLVSGQAGWDTEPPRTDFREAVSLPDTIRIRQTLSLASRLQRTNPDSAILLLDQALSDSRGAGYSYGTGVALGLKGSTLLIRGTTAEGLELLQAGIWHLLRTPSGKKVLPILYRDAGGALVLNNRFPEGARFLYMAAGLAAQDTSDELKAGIYTNLAGIFLQAPTPYRDTYFPRALYYFRQAELAIRRIADTSLLTTLFINMAGYYTVTGNATAAKHYNDSALLLARQGKSREQLHNALLLNAQRLITGGNPAAALPILEEAADIRAGVHPEYRIQADLALAEALIDLNLYRRAAETLDMARERLPAEGPGNAGQLKTIARLYYLLYKKQGNMENALQWQERYTLLKDSLTGMESARYIGLLEIQFRTAEREQKLARHELHLARQQEELLRKNLAMTIITGIALLLAGIIGAQFLFYRNRRKLREREQQLDLLKAVMQGEEKERVRIARELHDGIGGVVAAIRMNLNASTDKHPELSEQLGLDRIMHMLRDTSTEIRNTAHNLMPDVLMRYDLPKALEFYCDQINQSGNLYVRLTTFGYISQGNKSAELALYRMIQELIQNVLRHADATTAEVQLMQYGDSLHITVEDNGTGFDPAAASEGSGLRNLRSRIQSFEGTLSVMSSPGKSTTVHIEFQIEKLKLATQN